MSSGNLTNGWGTEELLRALSAQPSSVRLVTGRRGTTIETRENPVRAQSPDTTRGEAMSTPGIFSQRPLGSVEPAVLTDEQKQRVVAWDVACRTVGDWEDFGVDQLILVSNFLVDGLRGYQVTYDALYPPLTAEQKADLNRERMLTGGVTVNLSMPPEANGGVRADGRPDALYDPGVEPTGITS